MFPEANTLLALDAEAAADGFVSCRVRAINVPEVCVAVRLSVGAVADGANSPTITVKAWTAKTGGTSVNVPFKQYFTTSGDVLLVAGTGLAAKTVLDDDVTSVTTVIENALKEQIIQIPIRSRRIPAGHPWLAVNITGGAARTATVLFIRHGEDYQASQTQSPVLA